MSNRVSVMIGDRWYASIGEAEMDLRISRLWKIYKSAIDKGKIPLHNGQRIYYNVEKPVTNEIRVRKTRTAGESLLRNPVTFWLGGH